MWMKPISDMYINFWFNLSFTNKIETKKISAWNNYLNRLEILGLSVCEGAESCLVNIFMFSGFAISEKN